MLELLFIVSLLAWAVVSLLEYLAGLPAAPTLAATALLLPGLTAWRTRSLARGGGLDFVGAGRHPLPPERFYWPATRKTLGRRVVIGVLAAVLAWPVALAWPARSALDPASLAGWIAAIIGISAAAEVMAATWLYLRASQRFDHLAPKAIGWLRVGLYRLSDNHEFLGEEPLPRQKRARESVY